MTNRNSSNACECHLGFYADNNNCTSIHKFYQYKKLTNNYFISKKKKLDCSYKCSTCSIQDSNCTNCPSGSQRDNTSNCNCIEKHYDILNNPICQSRYIKKFIKILLIINNNYKNKYFY